MKAPETKRASNPEFPKQTKLPTSSNQAQSIVPTPTDLEQKWGASTQRGHKRSALTFEAETDLEAFKIKESRNPELQAELT
jgi:hypothetical protein